VECLLKSHSYSLPTSVREKIISEIPGIVD